MDDSGKPVVHVIDDDTALRTALMRLLVCAGYVARGYASAGEFLISEPDDRRGCILLDLELGGPSGLELQLALNRHRHALPVVFMSAYRDVPRTVQAMKAGAIDFLLKPFESATLLAALQDALASRMHEGADNEHATLESLGDREKVVLRGIVAGQRNRQIAEEMGLSERTIKSCRANLMRKFEATSLAELVRRAEPVVNAQARPS